jgi:hypothetical protein
MFPLQYSRNEIGAYSKSHLAIKVTPVAWSLAQDINRKAAIYPFRAAWQSEVLKAASSLAGVAKCEKEALFKALT